MGFPSRDRPGEREKRDTPRSTASARRSRDGDDSPSSRRSRSRHRSTPSQEEHEPVDSGNGRPRNVSREMPADYKSRSRRHGNSSEGENRGRLHRSSSRSEGEDYHRNARQEDDFGGDDRDSHSSRAFRNPGPPERGRNRDMDPERFDGGPERERYRNDDRGRCDPGLERERFRESDDRDRWPDEPPFRNSQRERDRDCRWERGRSRDWDREASGGGSRRRSIDRDWEDPERWRGNDGHRHESKDNRYEAPSEDRYPRMKNSPSTTIILQGLAPDIAMEDIRPVVLQCGLTPKGVRVIKRRDTGASRGFAFVEFYALQDAVRWMEITQGVLEFGERCRVTMEFSAPREEQRHIMSGTMDWNCMKCGINNFERRKTCYKCQTPKDGEDRGEGFDEVSYAPTKTLLLRGLDILSTVESVMEAMKVFKSVAIVSVRIGQDSLTNTSRGICYIDLKSPADAKLLHDALSQKDLVIEGRRVTVTYCKSPEARAPDAAASWRSQRPEQDMGTTYDLSQYTVEDVPRLAAYSASLYASNPGELHSYTEYYKQYYHSQLLLVQPAVTTGAPQMHVKNLCQSDDVNAGAAVAQAAIQQSIAAREVKRMVVGASLGRLDKSAAEEVCKMAMMKTQLHLPSPSTVGPHVPDVSTYQYDPSSGHYYDPQTGLYYDPTSQYYFNALTQQYSYWDPLQQAFLPAPATATATVPAPTPAINPAPAVTAPEEDPADAQRKDGKKDKPENKVKVAKRIAKDMERWAKALNQKKENVNQAVSIASSHLSRKSIGAADAGFAVLQRKDLCDLEIEQPAVRPQTETPAVAPPPQPRLVAAYDDASDDDIGDVMDEEAQHTDWEKLACLLCKRQFDKRETLVKHQQVSSLHLQNVETWYRSRGLDPNDAHQRNDLYRDRAKERRLKFGQPNNPQPNRLKEKYLKIMEDAVADSYEEPTKAGISSDNIGNRMLQKLGWKEGMGLGKANQGRTSIIQTKQRSATAGLGSKGSTYGALPGEAYKDSVKRAMFARYHELNDQEEAMK